MLDVTNHMRSRLKVGVTNQNTFYAYWTLKLLIVKHLKTLAVFLNKSSFKMPFVRFWVRKPVLFMIGGDGWDHLRLDVGAQLFPASHFIKIKLTLCLAFGMVLSPREFINLSGVNTTHGCILLSNHAYKTAMNKSD